MTYQRQVLTNTTANWATAPTLQAGRWGRDSDTGSVRVGDGSTAWASLPELNASASTFDPTTGPDSANLKVWLAPHLVDGAGPVADGTTISNWVDVSGNGHDADTVGGTAPKFATGVFPAGNDAVKATAVSGASRLTVTDTFTFGSFTIYCVFKRGGTPGAGSYPVVSSWGDTAFVTAHMMFGHDQNPGLKTRVSYPLNVNATNNVDPEVTHVQVWKWDGTTLTWYEDSTQILSRTMTPPTGSQQFHPVFLVSTGRGEPYYYGDVIYYSTAHSDTDRGTITSALVSQYGIT